MPMLLMRRDDYKAIKHMDKAQLTGYLERVWRRGYDAGVKAMAEKTGHTVTPIVAEATEKTDEKRPTAADEAAGAEGEEA